MIGYIDQPTHGSVLDIIEQEAEISFQAVDYDNFQPGKPFKSGQLSIPETANNRAILGSLFDADGAEKVRIIEGATYQNDVISLQGSIIITGQTFQNRTNILTGQFVSGNAMLWLDFGDTNLRDLDWSDYNHLLNYTNVIASQAGTGLYVYDLCDRGKFIDITSINLIERYPAFSIAEMLKRIFRGYDLQSNFIAQSWFTKIYQMFTGSSEIRNDEDWMESALISGEGDCTATESVPITTTINPWLIEATSDMDVTTDPYFDNGGNWNAGGYYLVPETGTYRFKATVSGGVDIKTGGGAQPPNNTLASTELQLKIISLNIGTIALYQKIDTTPTNPGREINLDVDLDTDFIELQKDDRISFYTSYDGSVINTTFPAKWEARIYTSFLVTNQVSRYYGYGSTVEINKLLPDQKVNDWLSDIFYHFGITPQFSNETNIVRLDTWQRQTTGHDLSYSVDPLTGNAEYMEPFNYEMRFKADSSDPFAVEFYKNNDAESGNYKAGISEKVLKIFESAFSNTVMNKCYRLGGKTTKMPTFYGDMPVGTSLARFTPANVPDWKTNFNPRLLIYAGIDSGTYSFGYHSAGIGRVVTSEDHYIFKPYTESQTIEFSNRLTLPGLHNRCHKAYIARINNGLILTIQGKADAIYLNNLINCDETVNMRTAIYINFDPFIGFYTVQKVTTDGIISQLQLIRNDE